VDALWWRLSQTDEPGGENTATEEAEFDTDSSRFGLERHLHEFLRDNWEHTALGKDWQIYEEDGDPEGGYEYPCAVGRIDLLAKHRTDARWLVIELKRNQSSDKTVGQVLRYVGWVKQHLAEQRDEVDGLVIAHKGDDTIRYALSATQGVELQLYEVQFSLRGVPPI